ncbi:tRNA-splicing endonuclease subunit Sen54 [Euwallacea fornicatus]|uniref:tRNA-splicing endonuclease subunit Sen54 n=1 Tax=Euwallacea fornicatus TaxID=995702 RepID=UPI00338F2537
MDELVTKCIQTHKHPIVKLNFQQQKFFLSTKTQEELKLVEECREYLRKILAQERVDKRSSRVLSTWIHTKNIAHVVKVTKNLLKYFGFQNKDGIFLYPEEMLFLLEMNRLELRSNNIVSSIERAYNLVLNTTDISLNQYHIYKKLALLGYKLTRCEQLHKKLSNNKNKLLKREIEDTDLHSNKRRKSDFPAKDEKLALQHNDKVEYDNAKKKPFTAKEAKYVSRIFEDIRVKMPMSGCNYMDCEKPDYYVFNPKNANKAQPNLKLFICKNNLLDHKGINEEPNIFATCDDDVTFYTLYNITLPFINY